MEIKNGKLVVYDVDNNYRNYLRKYEPKVSMKEERRFYGILVTNNGIDYCIPFTCKIKRRNSKLTVNIRNKGKVIAQLLINNMIPVKEKVISIVDVKNDKQREYLNNEIIYLRKEAIVNEILEKTEKVLKILEDKTHHDYRFFKGICCDYQLLEQKCQEYIKIHLTT